MLLHLGISDHGDRSAKLFGSHKPCYDGQWPLTCSYFRCWITSPWKALMHFMVDLNFLSSTGINGKICVTHPYLPIANNKYISGLEYHTFWTVWVMGISWIFGKIACVARFLILFYPPLPNVPHVKYLA